MKRTWKLQVSSLDLERRTIAYRLLDENNAIVSLSSKIALNPFRIADFAFERGADELIHDYDLRLATMGLVVVDCP
jgi:hypothetical protein